MIETECLAPAVIPGSYVIGTNCKETSGFPTKQKPRDVFVKLSFALLNNYQLNISIAFLISADVEGFSLISFISDKKSLWKVQLTSL